MSEQMSPLVHDDGSITLSLWAPEARSVQIHSDFRLGQEFVAPIMAETFPSLSCDQGLWSITTEAMLPGIYRYAFLVDGFKTLDPQNPWMRKAEMGQPFSMVRVPGDGPGRWDLNPGIPHGTVVRETFFSQLLGQAKRCNVYLPPGYEPAVTYPVLYLLHGGGNDYGHWVFDGMADNIMDALLAEGSVAPTVVVMPDGNVMPPTSYTGATRAQLPADFRERMAQLHPPYFVDELIPFVEGRYRVDGSDRAIAGLSMGCMQVWELITTRPELFSAAGLFSGTAEDAEARLDRVGEQLMKYRTVAVGVGDRDVTRIVESMRALPPLLDERGIPSHHFETVGGHIWAVWQRCLADFAPLL